ncbi:hypothetical protein ACWEN6_13900 [Sphaerisporangium sp. NPDC004334]
MTTLSFQAALIGGAFHVHRAGCADLTRNQHLHAHDHPLHVTATVATAIAAELYSDFIPGELTVADALGLVVFAPCTRLDTTAAQQFDLLHAAGAEAAVQYVMRRFGKLITVSLVEGPNAGPVWTGVPTCVSVWPNTGPGMGYGIDIVDEDAFPHGFHGSITIGEA